MSHPRPTSPKPIVPPPTYDYATRTIVPNPLITREDKIRRCPFVVKGQRVIRLLEANDASAVQLVLALVHDCFIFLNQIHLGHIPEDAFSLRRRLLSLYIVDKDITEYEEALRSEGLQYRYRVIIDLLALRERTLFSDDLRADARLAMDQRHELSTIIGRALMEPVQGLKDQQATSFNSLLRRVRDSIESDPTPPDDALKLCNDVRAFYKLAACIPCTRQVTELSPAREAELVLDILVALTVMYDCRPYGAKSSSLYVSLGNDPPDGLYSTSRRLTRQMLLARDVVCHLLPGPCTLQPEGGYAQYVKPLLQQKDDWLFTDYQRWFDVRDKLVVIESAFEKPFEPARPFEMGTARGAVGWLAKVFFGWVLPEHYVMRQEIE